MYQLFRVFCSKIYIIIHLSGYLGPSRSVPVPINLDNYSSTVYLYWVVSGFKIWHCYLFICVYCVIYLYINIDESFGLKVVNIKKTLKAQTQDSDEPMDTRRLDLDSREAMAQGGDKMKKSVKGKGIRGSSSKFWQSKWIVPSQL